MGPALRNLAVLAGIATSLYVAALQGRGSLARVAIALSLAWLVARIILPRAAHRAFGRGEYRRAGLFYRLLAAVRIDPRARAAARVSRAACAIGRQDFRRGLADLGADDDAGLPETTRAAWLNNRAYAMCRSGGDPSGALALAERAVALRPDVPGFRHTRGIALLASGRVDDAIRELDEVWRRHDERRPAALLEAERCFDLGQAWSQKGDLSQAADYFDRARQSAPGSSWAGRASARLPADWGTRSLTDLVGS